MGITEPGCLAEFVRIPAARAVTLPDSVDDGAATVLEPMAVGLHLLEQIADRPGSALILGSGPIGLIAGLLLQEAGRRVVIAEPHASRRAQATRMGIREAISLQNLTGFWEGPLIIETSGHPSASEVLKKTAAPGTTILLVGGNTTVPGYVILTRELEVRAVKGGRGLYPEAVGLVCSGRLCPGRLISHRFPAREVHRAFETALHRDVATRVMLDMTTW
jgi:threonine dehydrogenase-like Zn-dependent dehydrogenase